MRYGSLFAGAGGIDLGFDAAGWECAWQVEIDPKARLVLARHWPDAVLYEDVCAINGAEIEPVDVISGGFPCQDLSVAGRRAGFDGARSGLFFEFVRIVKEMRDATDGLRPRWVVWENVAGLLSIAGGLATVYAGWDEIGAVVQEHRVVDGRYFGVPQRRRRVVGVVGFDPRSEHGPEILFDTGGVPGDFASGSAEAQTIAALTANGVGAGGGPDDNAAQAGHLIAFNGFNGLNIQPSEFVTPTLRVAGGGSGKSPQIAYLLPDVDEAESTDGAAVRSLPFPTFSQEGELHSSDDDIVAPRLGVRRLTAKECERLMGWGDDHTAVSVDGKQIADTHRYRLCGNGVIAPMAEWVANRIDKVEVAIASL